MLFLSGIAFIIIFPYGSTIVNIPNPQGCEWQPLLQPVRQAISPLQGKWKIQPIQKVNLQGGINY